MVSDLDLTYEGMEVWSFSDIYNAPSDELTTNDESQEPWLHLGISEMGRTSWICITIASSRSTTGLYLLKAAISRAPYI